MSIIVNLCLVNVKMYRHLYLYTISFLCCLHFAFSLCSSFSFSRKWATALRLRAWEHGESTYSWINPKLHQRKNNTDLDQFKRIQFDGCGSVLILSEVGKISLQRTGLSLWSAAYVMSYYIDEMWSQQGRRNRNENPKWTVLDLGAGLGLCSAVAAKHGMNVISTDIDSQALVLLEENLERNCKKDSRISVHSLDWIASAEQADITTNPVFSEIEGYGGVDLIMLSDVIYSATKPAWGAVIVLLEKLRIQRKNVEKKPLDSTDAPVGDPLVLLSYTQRRRDMSAQDEAEFFALLRESGMEADMVPSSQIPHGDTYMLTTLFKLRWLG